MIADVKKSAEQKMQKSVEALKVDLGKVRTGRAHTGLLDHLRVDYYGSMMPISQVANVTLADAHTIAVQPWEKKMVQVVEKALEQLQTLRAGRHIDITVGILPTCLGDSALLEQVFINLIGNAIKYTERKDPARVEVGCQTTDGGPPVYYVKDNGAGFDMRYADKLFGVFQRLHRSDEFEGTGIGLAIVQRIVHRHGGRIWPAAEVGQGATFFFTLRGETQWQQLAA